MSSFTISANYNKNEHSSEMKPTITNTVNVTNKVGTDGDKIDATATESSTLPAKILPPKNILMARQPLIDETKRIAFEHRLLEIFRYLLTRQNKVLVNNILELGDEVLLALQDLKEVIGIATGESEIEVIVGESPVSVGCLKGFKVPFWSPITRIIVCGLDFEIGYNRIYNMLVETYGVSLTKVVV